MELEGATPWVHRGEIGIPRAAWLTCKKVMVRPGEFFDSLERSPSWREPFLFYLAIQYTSYLCGLLLSVFHPGFNAADLAIAVPIGALLIPAGAFIGAGAIHLGVKLFKGQGSFRDTFHVTCYGSAPALFSFVPIAGGLVSGIWSLVLIVKGVRRLHGFSARRAVWAVSLVNLIGFLIAVALALLIPNMRVARVTANETAARAHLQVLVAAAQAYQAEHSGAFPSSEQDMVLSLPRLYHGQTVQGYVYSLDFPPQGYAFSARPESCGRTGVGVFSVSSDGNMTVHSCYERTDNRR